MENKLKISGPENVIRMEGMFQEKKKILYIFFDVHRPLMGQTHCNEDKIYDTVNYFVDNFQDTNEKINFFLEIPDTVERAINLKNINPDMIPPHERPELYQMHLVRMRNFFSRHFNYDEVNNVVNPSKIYKNVFFHFIDFRWIYIPLSKITNNIHQSLSEENLYNLEFLLQDLVFWYNIIKDDYTFIYNGTQENAKKLLEGAPKMSNLKDIYDKPINEVVLSMYRYIYKILYSYTNKDVQKIVLNIINSSLKNAFETMLKNLETVINLIVKKLDAMDEYTKNHDGNIFSYDCKIETTFGMTQIEIIKFFYEVRALITQVNTHYNIAYAEIIDCYFIRRLMDKDYADKNIVYCGSFHASNYAHILAKYFNFYITHYSYSKYDLKTTMEKLKENDCSYDLLIPLNSKLQCSDMSEFPKNFN